MVTPSPLSLLLSEYAALAARPSMHPNSALRASRAYYRYEARDPTSAVPGEQPPIRMIVWFANLHRLEVFVAAEGRLPRQNRRASGAKISAEERTLATWVRAERTAGDHGHRTDYQLRRLACVAGYRAHPLEDRWDTRFNDYEELLDHLGRPPVLSSDNPAEKSLSGWAAKQRLRYRDGTLPARRQRMLESLHTWTWGGRRP
jgi:hypothetical protein